MERSTSTRQVALLTAFGVGGAALGFYLGGNVAESLRDESCAVGTPESLASIEQLLATPVASIVDEYARNREVSTPTYLV